MPTDRPRPGGLDPKGTTGPIIVGTSFTAAYGALEANHPLLLLPVRLETRFEAASLKVRIYPDQIHLDAHETVLTEAEAALGRTYWARRMAAQADPAEIDAWLARQLLPRRAVWVARQTRPEGRLPSKVTTRTSSRPGLAAALPDRFAVVGWVEGVQRFVKWGAAVADALPLSPDPQDAAADDGPLSAAMAWMIDYDAAVTKGMGVTVPLDDDLLAHVGRHGLTLLVVGIRGETPSQGADTLLGLLEAHHYTDGLAFLPQGTPTNNTDEASAGWTPSVVDVPEFFARELDGVQGSVTSAAGHLAAALGLDPAGLLARVRNGSHDEASAAAAMNRVLWPVGWGQYFEVLLGPIEGGDPPLSQRVRDSLREWFVDHVRGGAPLPTLAIGTQPYGVLPVRRTVERRALSGWHDTLEWVLLALRERWRESLPLVPRLDPVRPQAASDDPEQDALAILASVPHPGRLVVRRLSTTRSTHEFLWNLGWLRAEDDDDPLRPMYAYYEERADTVRDVRDQLAVLAELRDALPRLLARGDALTDGQIIVDYLVLLVETHAARQEPVITYFPASFDGRYLPTRPATGKDPRVFWAGYGNATEDRLFTRPLVQAAHAEPAARAATYLPALRERVPGLVATETDLPLGGRAPVARSVEISGETGVRPGSGPGSPPLVSPEDSPRGPSPDRPGRRPRPTDGRPTISAPDDGPRGSSDSTGRPTTEGPAGTGPDELSTNPPLLYQLVDLALKDDVPLASPLQYRSALSTLADTPVAELELRLRESLGLMGHRLDAWLTGFASERLQEMRAPDAKPRGVQLGAFGWVEDLRPDESPSRTSSFVHAPSLAHAATAAVLRAGWSMHSAGVADGTLAIDLRSARVRAAAWLLDGVRQGQSLGELLGYRFERSLHDGRLDWFIDDCRAAVLASRGVARAPRASVDGLDLLALYQSGGVTVDGGRATLRPDATPSEAYRPLKEVLDDLLGTMDAVADASLADSVHSLLQGNATRASATLDAISTGAVPPPELRGLRTPRGGTGVTHRLVLTLGGDPEEEGDGWVATGPRARLYPAHSSWVATLLPPPAHVVCAVTIDAADGPTTQTLRLSDAARALRLSALDAVFISLGGDPQAESGWGQVVTAYLRTFPGNAALKIGVDFDGGAFGPQDVTLRELADLATRVRALLGQARALDARDLVVASEAADPGWDLDAAEAELRAAEVRFEGAVTALEAASGEALRGAMSALMGYGLEGAAPYHAYTDDDAGHQGLAAEASALAERARARLAAGAALQAEPAPTSPDLRFSRVAQRIGALFGREMPVIVSFRPVDPAAVTAAFAESDRLLGQDPAVASGWLQDVGRVRRGAALLDEVVSLSELLLGSSRVRPRVGQLPTHPGEPWVARHAPTADRAGRLALLAVDHGGLAAAASRAPVHGLVLDGWQELIPEAEVQTGVALHFDAPSSRPPQSLLLLVPPDGETWSFDLVVDSLVETFEAAKLRAVDLDVLAAYGHHFPAVFPPGGLSAGAQPEAGTASGALPEAPDAE